MQLLFHAITLLDSFFLPLLFIRIFDSVIVFSVYTYLNIVLQLHVFVAQEANALHMPGDVAMNVNGKAELIMIKFVIPNKSIN